MTDSPATTAQRNAQNEPQNDTQEVTDRLATEYAELMGRLGASATEADKFSEVTDEDQHKVVADWVVKLRDLYRHGDAIRVTEGQQHHRRWQATNGFFNPTLETVAKVGKKLTAIIGTYQRRKEAEERARREREETDRRRIAKEAEDRAAEEARIAEEARLAADRAKKPEHIETKTEIAQDAEAKADVARVDSMLASAAVDTAAVAAAQKPAELARSRFEGGRVSTLKLVGYVEITDKSALDLKALAPFIKEEALLAALRAWAKINDYKIPMAGAVVEKRPEAVIK